jgi:hypothetical protein
MPWDQFASFAEQRRFMMNVSAMPDYELARAHRDLTSFEHPTDLDKETLIRVKAEIDRRSSYRTFDWAV